MSNLIRWHPMRDFLTMQNAMDRIFEDVYPRKIRNIEGYGIPALDLYQTDDEIVIKASLPGVKPDDIHISVTGDVLCLRGEIGRDEEVNDDSYHLRERSYGKFSRSISLPAPVVSDKAKAEFDKGILTLVLPKSEEVRPKTITVKAK